MPLKKFPEQRGKYCPWWPGTLNSNALFHLHWISVEFKLCDLGRRSAAFPPSVAYPSSSIFPQRSTQVQVKQVLCGAYFQAGAAQITSPAGSKELHLSEPSILLRTSFTSLMKERLHYLSHFC